MTSAPAQSFQPTGRAYPYKARGWAGFWTGRLDLDALAREITELVDDIDIADHKVEEASQKAIRCGGRHTNRMLAVSHVRSETSTADPGIDQRVRLDRLRVLDAAQCAPSEP